MKNILYEQQTKLPREYIVALLASIISIAATAYSYINNYILLYGDAESHLNIAKRVIHSLTPGVAQLGGVWLPLPHILMIPFVYFDRFWQTGLGGAMVSEFCFIITCVFLYKITYLITRSSAASFFSFAVVATNPNLLYLQTTPMSELPLIAFFILSTYFFFKFLLNDKNTPALLLAAVFGFCASLSRYDGWFLVLVEAGIIILFYLFRGHMRKVMEGKLILFATIALFGIFLWMFWDLLILGDPMYFTNSPFSAKSQQQAWLIRGQLPAYKNWYQSFLYYAVTALANAGNLMFGLGIAGLVWFLFFGKGKNKLFMICALLVPLLFYVITLYLGQSVIFIPQLTPTSFTWRLFNVRYGVMMIPALAFFGAYLFAESNYVLRVVMIGMLLGQSIFFLKGYEPVISWQDGKTGLSAAKRPDAEHWMQRHYDKGLVLLDDYQRTISIVRSNVPMQDIIYIGNKPYWDDSLREPEKYATWVVMQKNDAVWKNIYENDERRGRLYKYFVKEYTSPNILIFKRISSV